VVSLFRVRQVLAQSSGRVTHRWCLSPRHPNPFLALVLLLLRLSFFSVLSFYHLYLRETSWPRTRPIARGDRSYARSQTEPGTVQRLPEVGPPACHLAVLHEPVRRTHTTLRGLRAMNLHNERKKDRKMLQHSCPAPRNRPTSCVGAAQLR
jgi:hypothetical protein